MENQDPSGGHNKKPGVSGVTVATAHTGFGWSTSPIPLKCHCKCLGVLSEEYSALLQLSVIWLCPGCKCIYEESYNRLCSGISQHYPDPGLFLLNTNCQSVLSMMDDVRVLTSSSRPDFIGLTETWLDSDIRPSEVAILFFLLICRERSHMVVSACMLVSLLLLHLSAVMRKLSFCLQ